jgi:hypothetical protein
VQNYTTTVIPRYQKKHTDLEPIPSKGKAMKVTAAKPSIVEHRIWCSSCCIRIAPTEEQTASDGKVFHSVLFLETSE